MRNLSFEEIDQVSGGMDSSEMCRYAVIGGAGLAIGAVAIWATAAWLPIAGGITAGTLMMGSSGYVTMSAGTIAAGNAAMIAGAQSAGVAIGMASTALSAVGSVCSMYS